MKNRLLLLACFLVAATCLPGQTPGQPAEPTVYTSAQILPFLRLYDLEGLSDLIHRGSDVGKEVAVSFNDYPWYNVPFKMMRVEGDNVSLKTDERGYYVLLPFLPPTLEKLAEARTFQEVLQTLVPPSRSGNEAYFNIMYVPESTQFLELDKGNIGLILTAAYLYQDRIVWVECEMHYKQSKVARTVATPFDESVIQIHLSPKYK
ncbi:hypothetical protein [Prosthecobacter fluviatilis]|uniref:Lipoprotein n=1 Tax=Prosthecobacter fluviatilis TaxID=445931 RepID=A0ABW0KXQ4_9BACT